MPLADVREAVLDLRRGKGMVVDPADPDTWSAGSFFTNPVLDAGGAGRVRGAAAAGSRHPSWPAPGGRKLSAAWLIERAGFAKGYGAGAGADLHQAHAGAHQPRRRQRRRPGRARPRGPRRRGDDVRRRAATGAAPGRGRRCERCRGCARCRPDRRPRGSPAAGPRRTRTGVDRGASPAVTPHRVTRISVGLGRAGFGQVDCWAFLGGVRPRVPGSAEVAVPASHAVVPFSLSRPRRVATLSVHTSRWTSPAPATPAA